MYKYIFYGFNHNLFLSSITAAVEKKNMSIGATMPRLFFMKLKQVSEAIDLETKQDKLEDSNEEKYIYALIFVTLVHLIFSAITYFILEKM